MFRRSLVQLSNNSTKAPRTIIRDPRKNKAAKSAIAVKQEELSSQLQQQEPPPPVPFAPSENNLQSVGSSLGSYALAGAGMAMGFTLVGAIFGL
mmetsp:Transcript_1626/g.2425  ORF Transcript_1626/g.2425 Transcript_1626/m.2425 type:complete len:94 (+) Transcript_1626:239-520(+)|eukprot:CAMPEP_0197239876 /NCGR_PEP_ID=MMETSP1429-20130617/6282_1 /TAXON_ID=49237 /ORGANISM="Chaetoceros  sp., Strain UNC1202" /LENGTH=93 /DNA_ID=CAMNT_0042699395 /DNA_START=181 /DNA_END=462 /DNA_ORIENTATION=+